MSWASSPRGPPAPPFPQAARLSIWLVLFQCSGMGASAETREAEDKGSPDLQEDAGD